MKTDDHPSSAWTDFFVHPEWREPLSQAGLLDPDACMNAESDDYLSLHKRGWVRRVELSDGRSVFLKVDAMTKVRRIVSDLVRLCRPQPLTFRERERLRRLKAAGLRGPEVLAWAQRRRNFMIPHQAIMILSDLEGVSLKEYMASPRTPEQSRAVMLAVGREVGRLYRAGFNWPDLHVKHVFVTPEPRVSFLDVDRMTQRKWGLARAAAKQLAVLADQLRGLCATNQELAALLAGLAETAPPAIVKPAPASAGLVALG